MKILVASGILRFSFEVTNFPLSFQLGPLHYLRFPGGG